MTLNISLISAFSLRNPSILQAVLKLVRWILILLEYTDHRKEELQSLLHHKPQPHKHSKTQCWRI